MDPETRRLYDIPSQQVDVNGTLILVFGILGLTVCGCLAPFAWSMGNSALRQLDEMRIYEGNERSMANIGRILGIIGTLIIFGSLLLVLLMTLVGAGAGSR